MQRTLFDEIQPALLKKLSAFCNYFCLSLEEPRWVMQAQLQCRGLAMEKDGKKGLGSNVNKISVAKI